MILLIDFKKAFDSISHEFIYTTLHKMGFGPDICTWIKTFLSHRESFILLGGHLTDAIKLEQGVPQGDIISPYLFLLMVEVLLIKITKTKNIEGITYFKTESRAEAFADDTTLFMTRKESNLRFASRYINKFHSISGLACNMDKTNVIPVGAKNDIKDILCPDLGMEWTNTFTILGFDIDSKLEKLDGNYDRILDKIKSIIKKWKPYNLSLRGRLTIAKTMLVSQITYISSVLTPNAKKLEEIQLHINNYVMNITQTSRNWINSELLYTSTNKGGLGMIRLTDFLHSIKCSCIRRYCIDKLNDHWADKIDSFFGLTNETRHTLLSFGPEKFNAIIKAQIPVISSMFASYKLFKAQFPSSIENGDNTWVTQNIFFNMNFARTQPRTRQLTHLTPSFYGIPHGSHTLRLIDFYPNLSFITNQELNTLTGTTIIPLNYKNLEKHIKKHVGLNKTYDAIIKKSPQRKHTQDNTHDYIAAIKNGSNKLRKIIARRHKQTDIHNPKRWRKKLDATNVTRKQVKQSTTRLHSKYINSHNADHLSRLKLGKTYFNAQLHHINLKDTPYCTTCHEQHGVEVSEDYKHALYHCPNTRAIIHNIIINYFPDTNENNYFSISDILVDSTHYSHKTYEGNEGKQLINIIWDTFQVSIATAHSAGKPPTYANTNKLLTSALTDITKLLPLSKVSKAIKRSELLSSKLK